MSKIEKKDFLYERAELLERVANALERRGIDPASDIEKLRVFANQLREIKEKVTEFVKGLRLFKGK